MVHNCPGRRAPRSHMPRIVRSWSNGASIVGMVTEATLEEFERLLAATDPGPWVSRVEGRDGVSGASFIRTGPDDARGEDLYISRDVVPAPAAYLDLIALMRTMLPELIKEVRQGRAT